jgi:phosphonate transport system permease protein
MMMLPPVPESWGHFWIYVDSLGQTLAIALLGTLLGAVLGGPFGFLAARNVVANRLLHWLVRRGLDTVRSIDALIWALIWINVVGLGPFAGVLAIASADCAAFAKLISEMIEACDRKPIDGIVAAGGGRFARLRFGILPQILPVAISQVLYFFESNTRSATIIGVVGAGGVGLWLSESIRVLEWQETAFLIAIVLLAVIVIDTISWRIRRAVLGRS